MHMTRRRPAILALLVAASLAAGSAPALAKPHPKDTDKTKKLEPTRGKKTRFEFQGAILARPDAPGPDPSGTHKWSGTGKDAPGSPLCAAHFCVHWTQSGVDASNSTYAQQMLDILENEVYPCENGTAPTACAGKPGLGWRDPPSDFGLGGGTEVDVYIQDLFSTAQVYGYTALDPGQTRDPSVPHFSYMVMDKDYSRYGGGGSGGATGIKAEQVTAAHEYNHVLQNGYDYIEDPWMFEATAVYIEDKVYPDINDYLAYVNLWAQHPDEPLTLFSDDLKPYGSAVWNHWLDHQYGPNAVRAAWENSVASADFAPAAYSSAITAAGGPGFSGEFGRFAAAVAEWDVPGAGFPDRYPQVPRITALPVDAQFGPFNLPHTTFAYFDVPIPSGAPPTIRLIGTLPQNTTGAVALVGRTGTDPNAGNVTTSLTPIPTGGNGVVFLDNPSQFGRITAVIANSDISIGGFDSTADDYIFTRDATGVMVSLMAPGLALLTTGPAGSITDHTAVASATVDPHLNETSWQIEYGPTIAYGQMTPLQAVPGSTVGAAAVSAPLSDLKALTTYHYRVIATNASGSSVGNDMVFTTVADVTPPRLFLSVKPQRLRTVRTRGLLYTLRCSEQCSGTVQLSLSRAVARKLKLPRVLISKRVSLPVRATSTPLRALPSAKVRRLLAKLKSGTRLRTTIELRLTDESENLARATRAISLR
jgi:hypothetical protein